MISDPPPASTGRTLALGRIRHACHACGTCCTGWVVLLGPDEHERIERHAQALGVDDPIVEGRLRQVDARCVFLGEDRLCRIHAAFGGTEKPMVCQAYPRMMLLAEDGLRLGADPGCSSTWRSFRDGPELDMRGAGSPAELPLPPELAEAEEAVLELCLERGMTLATLIARICGDESHLPAIPPALTQRFLTGMKALDAYLADPVHGPILVAELAPLRDFLRDFDPAQAPRLECSAEVSALALETIRRTLFLRIGDAHLPPLAKLVLLLAGAIACAAAAPRIERFGPLLAAWSRASRLPGFWTGLIPDAATAQFLLAGRWAGPAEEDEL